MDTAVEEVAEPSSSIVAELGPPGGLRSCTVVLVPQLPGRAMRSFDDWFLQEAASKLREVLGASDAEGNHPASYGNVKIESYISYTQFICEYKHLYNNNYNYFFRVQLGQKGDGITTLTSW